MTKERAQQREEDLKEKEQGKLGNRDK